MFRAQAFDFTGKSVIVTGAGRGIGQHIAKSLHQAGAIVYAVSRNHSTLEKLKSEFPQIHAIQCDLSNYDETRSKIEAIPLVDYLVNNAAVIANGTSITLKGNDFDMMFKTNLQAVLNVSQIVAEKMMNAGVGGAIVNISSVAGIRPMKFTAGYSVLKAALDHLTQIMAQDFGPKGIRVNSVNPGPVLTDMLQTAMENIKEATGSEMMDELKERTPFTQHIIGKAEISNLVMFLLSDAAPMVHGTIIPIDGGLHCV